MYNRTIIILLLIICAVGTLTFAFADERVQQFIHDREVHEYEPIHIKYWSYSSKQWVHNSIDGSGSGQTNTFLEIIILQNERIIELLENAHG